MQTTTIKTLLLLIVLLLMGSLCPAQAPFKPRKPAFDNPPFRPRRSASDPTQVIPLVRRMMRPDANYSGEQMTELTERGGHISRQMVYGDIFGHIRRDFLEPDALKGDVMITGLDRYYYFHQRSNVVDIALWPTDKESHFKRIVQMVVQNQATAERVGEEVIAGRTAVIVSIQNRPNPAIVRNIKFWIDRETGILLKNEISNQRGLVSRSYFTSIAVGAAVNVLPRMFEPTIPQGATVHPLLPPKPQYSTLEEAKEHLPFQPLVPSQLPPGYQVTGVWVVEAVRMPPSGMGAVIIRYGEGMGQFTLFQKVVRQLPPNQRPPRPFRGQLSILHWFASTADGRPLALTYIGALPAEQLEALRSSTH
ncbi:MAG: hypothetical protein NT023_16035 [Armatimonadetes bacterium]|nr:hypothetical protein [Armatimonadota bacterium]